jgi:hypothetical protein
VEHAERARLDRESRVVDPLAGQRRDGPGTEQNVALGVGDETELAAGSRSYVQGRAIASGRLTRAVAMA